MFLKWKKDGEDGEDGEDSCFMWIENGEMSGGKVWIPVFWMSDIPMLRCSDAPMLQCSDVPMLGH